MTTLESVPSVYEALARALKKGFVDHGLVAEGSKIDYLRHPLLLWHIGGRWGETVIQDGEKRIVRGNEWNYKFLGVGPNHLKVLGMSPNQREIESMTDLDIEQRAKTLFESKLYFQGGFAALVRTPPSNSDESTYNAVALRRMMWVFVKKIGMLSPEAVLHAMQNPAGIELEFTKLDAREVFPSKKLSVDELNNQWDQLLSTFRIPTLHLVGAASAGFQMEMSKIRRRDERAFQLWTGRSEWTATAGDKRVSRATILFPPIQLLLAVGTVRAMLGRVLTGARTWDPYVWKQMTTTLDLLPEGAHNLALHTLLASDDAMSARNSGNALPYLVNLDWTHHILGIAPPPYTDRRVKHKVQGILKTAAKGLVEHYRSLRASDPLCDYFDYLGSTSLVSVMPTGNTTILVGALPADVDQDLPQGTGDTVESLKSEDSASGNQPSLFPLADDETAEEALPVAPSSLKSEESAPKDCFPLGDASLPGPESGSFPLGDTAQGDASPSVTLGRMPFPLGDTPEEVGNMSFPLGDAPGKMPFPLGDTRVQVEGDASPSVTRCFPLGDKMLPLGRQNASPSVTGLYTRSSKLLSNSLSQTHGEGSASSEVCEVESPKGKGPGVDLTSVTGGEGTGTGKGLGWDGKRVVSQGEEPREVKTEKLPLEEKALLPQKDPKADATLMPVVKSLHQLGAWGTWDTTHEASESVEAVLRHLLKISNASASPLETQFAVHQHRASGWTVKGTWALCEALRSMGFPAIKGMRMPGKMLGYWLAMDFEKAADSSRKLLFFMQSVMQELNAFEALEPNTAASKRQWNQMTSLGIKPLPGAKAPEVVQAAPERPLFATEAPRGASGAPEASTAASEAWRIVSRALAELLSEAAMREWITPIVPVRLLRAKDGVQTLVLDARVKAAKLWIDQMFAEEIQQALVSIGQPSLRIELVVGE